MKDNKEEYRKEGKIQGLITSIEAIIEAIYLNEQDEETRLGGIHQIYQESAQNLIHYATFRTFDLRNIQKRLQNLGFTRLANAEGHLLFSLLQTRFNLYRLLGEDPSRLSKPGVSIKKGKKTLNTHTKALFGKRKGRRVRIMVTQPTEAAFDYQMVYSMVLNGMNCARVNCAHDGPEIWKKIINNVRKAAIELNKDVKVAMDLAGPKIRTGHITPGPKVRKFSPKRDVIGTILNPATIILIPEITKNSPPNSLSVSKAWFKKLSVGDTLRITDTRNKIRKVKVVFTSNDEVHLHCKKTVYVNTGTVLQYENGDGIVGELPQIEQYLLLKTGDYLIINKSNNLGNPAQYSETGALIEMAHISCQVPEIFDNVKKGESILFDDGKIEGLIDIISPDHMKVRITRAAEKGAKLKAEKGMNFPTTNLGISGLTTKDKIDLEFVAKHADIVNFSFVNSANDVEELIQELEKWDVVNKLNVILKIETRFGFDNLKDILLAAMQIKHIGVMIARGDLAVETGWDGIGKAQEGILALCGAAHIPVVWATQVLESLAKNGLPSRSEITDTINSLQSECVMLNKGPYIIDVLKLLNNILSNMEQFHEKKELMLPKMPKL